MGRRPQKQSAHIWTLEIAWRRKEKKDGNGDLEGVSVEISKKISYRLYQNRHGDAPYR